MNADQQGQSAEMIWLLESDLCLSAAEKLHQMQF